MKAASTSALALGVILAASAAEAQTRPVSRDMGLVGYNDLQGRSAYQPLIHKQGDRFILYVGHHGGKAVNPMTGQTEDNGTSIIDVTNPRAPKYLKHIPGEEGVGERGGAQMVRVCDGKTLPKGDPKATYLLRTFGNAGHEVWDTTDPSNPKQLAKMGPVKGTHKNWWECDTGIAYLVSGQAGWRTPRMTEIYDLSDPAKPVKVRDFGLVGQQPNATGPTPTNLHGAYSLGPKSNRVLFAYGTNANGVMQIVDRNKLLTGAKEPTPENLLSPQISRLDLSSMNGVHTAYPIMEMPIAEFARDKVGKTRNIVVISNEAILNECLEARQFVWIVDITVEHKPVVISTWQVPERSGNFCERGGRFGVHSSHENPTPIYHKRIMFFAYFNAGLRAVDIRDPYRPREIAYYIPALTKNADKRCIKLESGEERCKTAIQTNNVEVDDRGYVFIVDRANNGAHILELTGAARRIANFQQVSEAPANGQRATRVALAKRRQ